MDMKIKVGDVIICKKILGFDSFLRKIPRYKLHNCYTSKFYFIGGIEGKGGVYVYGNGLFNGRFIPYDALIKKFHNGKFLLIGKKYEKT